MRIKTILLFIFLFPVLLAANPFIHRDGKQLRDADEKIIRLNGVNLGGWLLWEGWIWGGKLTGEKTIFSNMQKGATASDATAFRDSIYRNFICEDDIKSIASLGFNVVRVPFNKRIFDTVNGTAPGWAILDSLLFWCGKNKVYAVLDMHGAPGGQSSYFIADPEKTILWKSDDHKKKTIALWKAIATHYQNNRWVAGYDLLNEPIPPNDKALFDLYLQIISAIRAVDTNHLIILEGTAFATRFGFFTSLPDPNMAFSFHIYTFLGGKPSNKVGPYTELGNRLNAPLWCGEWGENNYEALEETLKVLTAGSNDFDGWCFWTWKKVAKPNSTPALNSISVDENWRKFISWSCKPSAKNQLPQTEAIRELHAFENAIHFRNCKQDDKLAKLLTSYAK